MFEEKEQEETRSLPAWSTMAPVIGPSANEVYKVVEYDHQTGFGITTILLLFRQIV
jgi:hypothetical protein